MLVPRLVEPADLRLAIVGIFAHGIGMMDKAHEARAGAGRRPFQHLLVAVGVAEGEDGRRPMKRLMPTGLPGPSSMNSTLGSLISTGLPSRSSYFMTPEEPTTCSGGMP